MTPTHSATPTPSLTPKLMLSPTPTPYTFFLDGPEFSSTQGIVHNSILTSRFLFNGTGSSPFFPTDMLIRYNGNFVAIVSFAAEPGNNRTGTPFTWIVNYNDPNSPRFNGVFTNGEVQFNDPFQLSPTPQPSPTPTPEATPQATPTSTPTPTPTSTSTEVNVLFDKNSFIGKAEEPYLSALNAAADRWGTYLRIPEARLNAMKTLDPTFSGISLRTYTTYNDPYSNTIASCGPYNFVAFGSNHTLISKNFNLDINQRWEGTYTQQDWENILTHELGHALGIGIYWDEFFEVYGSEPPSNYFLNASSYLALSGAYSSLLGSRLKVALEDTGSSGTASSHWENTYRSPSYPFGLGVSYSGLINELMVGYYSNTINFVISPVSIKMLTDFGYEEKVPGASEGNPSLASSLQAGLQTNLQSNVEVVKYSCCNNLEVGEAEGVFDENNNLIAINQIIEIKP